MHIHAAEAKLGRPPVSMSSRGEHSIRQLFCFAHFSSCINRTVASEKLVVWHFINYEIRFFKLRPYIINTNNRHSHVSTRVSMPFSILQNYLFFTTPNPLHGGVGMWCGVNNKVLPFKTTDYYLIFKELLESPCEIQLVCRPTLQVTP